MRHDHRGFSTVFPGRPEARADFALRLREVEAANAAALKALTGAAAPDSPDLRADTLAEWQAASTRLWLHWQTHPSSFRPNLRALEDALLRRHEAQVNAARQRRIGVGRLVWVTQGDTRVRGAHAALHGQVFDWDDLPQAGAPGHDFNCRCVAVPLTDRSEALIDSGPEALVPARAEGRAGGFGGAFPPPLINAHGAGEAATGLGLAGWLWHWLRGGSTSEERSEDNEVVESRPSKVHPNLSAHTNPARKIAAAQNPGFQRWEAHHLIPFGVMAALPPTVQMRFVTAGWKMNSAENIVPLPKDFPTFISRPNNRIWPWHSGHHPNYDRDVAILLAPLAKSALLLSNEEILTGLAFIEAAMTDQLLAKRYHERLN